eukprot:6347968-Pyramimonas_sp.AAC.1
MPAGGDCHNDVFAWVNAGVDVAGPALLLLFEHRRGGRRGGARSHRADVVIDPVCGEGRRPDPWERVGAGRVWVGGGGGP